MKITILSLTFIIANFCVAQWNVGEYVNKRGKPTGDIFLYQEITGTYTPNSNSIRTCDYFIEHDLKSKVFGITIYPKSKTVKEFWKEDTFQWVCIEKPSGEIVNIEAFCFDGMIFFSEEEYDELKSALDEDGEYSVFMAYEARNQNLDYKFNFTNK